jgi:hypothetical protein
MSEVEYDSLVRTPKCYSYSIDVIVQVVAEDEESAKKQLDEKGGYVTKRTTRLVNVANLYNGEEA